MEFCVTNNSIFVMQNPFCVATSPTCRLCDPSDGQEASVVFPLGQWVPKIAVDAYVAPNVVLAGQITVYNGASVWNESVLRGDFKKITVGFCSNIQERCVLHAAWFSPTGVHLTRERVCSRKFIYYPAENEKSGYKNKVPTSLHHQD
ncbi:uncharacterized protein [Elaeis guineensis]|uniref:uncharacterized protein n=1 Tax=Elaeis guineensis var. tenera TaxID=51953 RepID=UPI003C6DAA72